MPSFQFRFESILTLYRRQRDEGGRELAETLTAIDRVNEQVADLQRQRDQIRSDAASRFGPGEATRISIERLQQEARYDRQLAEDQKARRLTCNQLEIELERRRHRLVEAEAEVKRLERLREKQAAAHNQLQLQREQATADELTISRMIHARRLINSCSQAPAW